MSKEHLRANLWAFLVTVVTARLIVLGSRNLANFDAALIGYTFATLFAVFGITRRYTIWLQRPPTAMYWKRGWNILLELLHPRRFHKNVFQLVRRFTVNFTLNRFIWRRGKLRGLSHWCIMWGSLIAAAITFPLVFGWINFVTEGTDFETYR